MKRLEGKVVIITGASSGFGREIAKLFATEGAKVVCSDIKEEGLDLEGPGAPTDKIIMDKGGKAIFVKCDVSKEAEVKALVETAVKKYGRLDIMVNNAGIMRSGALMHNFTESDIDAIYNVNIKGTWNGCKHALIQFMAQGGGGKIVNTCSTAALINPPGQMPYNVSKAAVAKLTTALALEYGRNKINVNAVCPTICWTPMSAPLLANEMILKGTESRIPLGRVGQMKDVANAMLFLASDEAEFITGVLLPIDGGDTLSPFQPSDMGL